MRYLSLLLAVAMTTGCSSRSSDDSYGRAPQPPVASKQAVAKAIAASATIDPRTMRTGDIGYFSSPVTVSQVTLNRSFIGEVDGERVLFTNFDTTDIPDGRTLDLGSQFFQCIGTTQYINASNVRRTVMTVRAFDPEHELAAVNEAKRLQGKAAD